MRPGQARIVGRYWVTSSFLLSAGKVQALQLLWEALWAALNLLLQAHLPPLSLTHRPFSSVTWVDLPFPKITPLPATVLLLKLFLSSLWQLYYPSHIAHLLILQRPVQILFISRSPSLYLHPLLYFSSDWLQSFLFDLGELMTNRDWSWLSPVPATGLVQILVWSRFQTHAC